MSWWILCILYTTHHVMSWWILCILYTTFVIGLIGLKRWGKHPTEPCAASQSLINIHTLQLNVLFSDRLFSKYAECIENVHCTPRTARRLREVLLVCDRTCERHID